MLSAVLLLLLGFVLIVLTANELVIGACAIAKRFNVSVLVIGLTIVALGTSAPEIFVSLQAAFSGNGGIAIGNAIGSNIANIGLVLGATALIRPLVIHSQTLKREYPILLFITGVSFVLLLDNALTFKDSVILFALLFGLLILMVKLAKTSSAADPIAAEFDAELKKEVKYPVARLIFGLIGTPLCAKLIVYSAVIIAKRYHLSDEIIGLTIIAIGTSLPEVATSIMGAIKGEDDLVIGNIIGSNMFNLLAVLPLASIFNTQAISSTILYRDYALMSGLTLLIFFMSCNKTQSIKRWHGAALLTVYVTYLTALLVS